MNRSQDFIHGCHSNSTCRAMEPHTVSSQEHTSVLRDDASFVSIPVCQLKKLVLGVFVSIDNKINKIIN